MFKRVLCSALLAGAISLPLTAGPVLASSDGITSTAAPPPNAVSALSTQVSNELILGRGTASSPFGTAQFTIVARPTEGKHGLHGDFRWDEADGNKYNGAIHGYEVNGNTATIDGAGGLVDANGKRHHVTFTATITEGQAGTGAIDVVYTGRDVNMHCQGTVTDGKIVFRMPPSTTSGSTAGSGSTAS